MLGVAIVVDGGDNDVIALAVDGQQLCRLQSAGLPSLVTTPFNRTTIPPIVVRLHTLQLYNYKPLDVQQ